MGTEAFETKLSEMSQIAPGEMRDDAAIDPQAWDSVEVLELIAAIDEGWGVTVPTAELNRCKTIGELRALIGRAAAAERA
jgi:acyl carrier protein